MTGDTTQLEHLIRSAQRGDRESFGELVERYASSLLYYFAVRGADPESAQDAVQETFIRAYQSLGKYDGRSPFPSWLYGIARNVRLQALRQQRRHSHEPILPKDALSEDDPERALLSTERRAHVRQALAELPDRMQLALQLRFVEKKSCSEIAQILGTTVASVSPLIYRAKSALQNSLRSKLQTPGAGQ